MSGKAGTAGQTDHQGNYNSQKRELTVRSFQKRDNWEWATRSKTQNFPTGGQDTHTESLFPH